MRRIDLLTPEVVAAIQEDARARFPHEACGVITTGGRYVALRNVSARPEVEAIPEPTEYELVLRAGVMTATVHSHPGGPNCPSEADMMAQEASGVPMVIVSTTQTACLAPFAFGDELETLPLVGRGFQHGVTDCYALIRDYFWLERGVRLPIFPRNWSWWNEGRTLYVDGFGPAGFKAIRKDEARPGDVALMTIRSPTPNHAGVLLDGGLILHHTSGQAPWEPQRLSCREPIFRWADFVTQWVRYAP